jgi:hypothetical protein
MSGSNQHNFPSSRSGHVNSLRVMGIGKKTSEFPCGPARSIQFGDVPMRRDFVDILKLKILRIIDF